MVEPKRCENCGELFYRSTTVPPTPLVTIEALRCQQKGKTYLLTDLPADTIDMLTDVPRFNWDLSYEEMAKLIFGYGVGSQVIEAWQRDLIESNLTNVARWWEEPRSNLVNSVVIGFKDEIQRPVQSHGQIGSDVVRIRETNSGRYESKQLVTIAIDNWLSTVCPAGHHEETPGGSAVYFDACPRHDCEYHLKTWRPAYLIDGQHRVRGIQKPPSFGSTVNRDVNKQSIPVAILGFGETEEAEPIASSEQAKVFTEISGKAVPLEWEHRLFLFYVFKTAAADMDMTLPNPPATNPLRQAYETIIRLTQSGIPNNPFQNRVKVLIPRSGGAGRTTALSFKRALEDWFTPWFSPTRIWASVSTNDAAREVVDLANAIRNIWSGSGPTSGSPYWQTLGPPNRTGIFSHAAGGDMSAFLRLFFDLYEDIRGSVAAPTRLNFQNFLRRKLYSPVSASSHVGQVAWDGPGWDSIRSPDWHYALLRAVAHDIITGDGNVEYDLVHHPAGPHDLNGYINLDPTVYEVSTTFGPIATTGTTIPVPSPAPAEIEINWRTPVLATSTVQLSVVSPTSGTVVTRSLDAVPGGRATTRLSQANHDFDGTPGTNIVVELRAENHKGLQDPPFNMTFQFQQRRRRP